MSPINYTNKLEQAQFMWRMCTSLLTDFNYYPNYPKGGISVSGLEQELGIFFFIFKNNLHLLSS